VRFHGDARGLDTCGTARNVNGTLLPLYVPPSVCMYRSITVEQGLQHIAAYLGIVIYALQQPQHRMHATYHDATTVCSGFHRLHE